MYSGESASRFDAWRIFGHRETGTLPLRRSSPRIDACDAMNRCASSDSDISSENSATAFLDSSAAFSAKFAISALLWTTMSSATKLWSLGTVRSYVSSSPRASTAADFIPPEVRRRELLELRAADRVGERCQLTARDAPCVDVPVVVAGVAGGGADVGPRPAALGVAHPLPNVGRQGVDVHLWRPGRPIHRDEREPFFLADDGYPSRERIEAFP